MGRRAFLLVFEQNKLMWKIGVTRAARAIMRLAKGWGRYDMNGTYERLCN
jgi:hypothetical protein